jgi:hypothetical protein
MPTRLLVKVEDAGYARHRTADILRPAIQNSVGVTFVFEQQAVTLLTGDGHDFALGFAQSHAGAESFVLEFESSSLRL